MPTVKGSLHCALKREKVLLEMDPSGVSALGSLMRVRNNGILDGLTEKVERRLSSLSGLLRRDYRSNLTLKSLLFYTDTSRTGRRSRCAHLQ